MHGGGAERNQIKRCREVFKRLKLPPEKVEMRVNETREGKRRFLPSHEQRVFNMAECSCLQRCLEIGPVPPQVCQRPRGSSLQVFEGREGMALRPIRKLRIRKIKGVFLDEEFAAN